MKSLTLIERYGFQDPDRRLPAHDQIQLWVYSNFIEILKSAYPGRAIPESVQPDLCLEYPITHRSPYNENVVGFIDIYSRAFAIAVEVKAAIPSVGDLVRQIQFYRQYWDKRWIVVSPDDRFQKVLGDHGILFYQADFKGHQRPLFHSQS